jgi:RHS repeat-associated protein
VESTSDAWGAHATTTGTATNDRGYAATSGYERNGSGLLDVGIRAYDPELGRFLQGDPAGTGYVYCQNTPANAVDPTGLYERLTTDMKDPSDYGYWLFFALDYDRYTGCKSDVDEVWDPVTKAMLTNTEMTILTLVGGYGMKNAGKLKVPPSLIKVLGFALAWGIVIPYSALETWVTWMRERDYNSLCRGRDYGYWVWIQAPISGPPGIKTTIPIGVMY